jgi:hypothetical protein
MWEVHVIKTCAFHMLDCRKIVENFLQLVWNFCQKKIIELIFMKCFCIFVCKFMAVHTNAISRLLFSQSDVFF